MVQINPNPFVLKNMILSIEADSFEKQVSSVELTPSSTPVVFKGLEPTAVYTDVTTASWVAGITSAQDWETPGSLSLYLFNNEGQTKAATLRPRAGRGPTFALQLVITPGAVGGAVDSTAVATVSLGVNGRPVIIPFSLVPVALSSDVVTSPIAGGGLIAIYGSGFTGATGVRFAAVTAAYRVISDSLIVATIPATTVGSKPITVLNASGASAAIPFLYA